MSLTSTGFIVVLVLLAAGSVGLALWAWRRLANPGWRPAALRLGTLLLVQVTGVALMASVINAQFDFYPTVQALFGQVGPSALQNGTRPTAGWVTSTSSDAAAIALKRPVRTPWGQLWADPQNASYGAGYTLDGELTGAVSHQSNSRLRVWLPAQYEQPAYRHHRFPVVMVLTGFPGNPLSWWKDRFPLLAQRAIDAHTMPPFVAVVLTPDPSPTRDTECANVPNGPQIKTFLGVDVPSDIGHLVRAAPPGHEWAAMGDSTGAYCSMLLAMDYSKTFPTAVSFGGYFNAITDITTGNLDGHSAAHKHLRDLQWQVTHLPPPPVSMFLTAATGDRTTVPDARAFVAAARPPLRASLLVTQGGGHNWGTWKTQLPAVLRWLGQRLGATTADSSPVVAARR
jgi:S-formylglutathione hydrolase FrmB